jgi:predicted nucleotidyltransferase
MNYLDKSILKTIIYWDIFDWPLSDFEIYRYLINPQRIDYTASPNVSMGEIRRCLQSEELSKYIVQTSGFWHLKQRDPNIVKERIRKELMADQIWKELMRKAKWFQVIPYIRLILVSGSMAIGNISSRSDWDLLIVTSRGRIWIARAFISIFTELLGWRRKDEINTYKKFCLNHFITESSLLINLPSIYNAQVYAHLVPIYGDLNLYKEFQRQNSSWIKSYLANYPIEYIPMKRYIRSHKAFEVLRKAIEGILNTRLGDLLEIWLGGMQAKKISSNPKTSAPGGRVRYSDMALEFHPESKERIIIQKLNQRLIEYGLSELADEKDSGLNPIEVEPR